MALPCRFCSPITIYIPQFFPQISYHDLGHLSFLISCYEFFLWSLIVYILPWCCACISCETNKLTTLYYCLTSEQEPQRIICTINFLCVSNLHNTSTCIYRQSSLNMLTYFVSVTANQSIQYMLTNRKIPYFKQFIHVHLLHHWNSLSLSKSGTLTSMFEILHQTLRIHIAVCTTNVCEIWIYCQTYVNSASRKCNLDYFGNNLRIRYFGIMF